MNRFQQKSNQKVPEWDMNGPTNPNQDAASNYSSVNYNILNFGGELPAKSQYPTQYQEDFGKNAKKYSDEEQAYQAYDELNRIRQNPQSYIPYLQDMLKNFNGNIYTDPKSGIRMETAEGQNAVHNAINFLKQQQPLPPIQPKLGLQYASEDHADDMGGKGLTSHKGSKGSSMADRLNRYGDFKGKVGQLMSFGFQDGRDLIKQLVVDDGDPNRNSRQQIFSQDMKNVGVGVSDHKDYDNCGVINYAQDYQDKPGIQAKRKPRNQATYEDADPQDDYLNKQKQLQDQLDREYDLKAKQLAMREQELARQQQDQMRLLDEKQRRLDEEARRQRELELQKQRDAQNEELLRRQREIQEKEEELARKQLEQMRLLQEKEKEMARLEEERRLQEERDRLMYEEELRRQKEYEMQKNNKYTHYTMRSAGIASKEENPGKDNVLVSDVKQFGDKYTSSEFKRGVGQNDPDKPDNCINTAINKIWDEEGGERVLIIKKTYILKTGDVKTVYKKYKNGILIG